MPLQFEAPSSDLQRELNEVAKKALVLDEYVLGANVLPPEFPTDQVRTLCESLGSLRYGTAEGCREPLVYARNRLPSIRREHISSDDGKIVSKTDDSSPLILRGEELDRRLSELAISVVTALDQYQSDSSEILHDSIDAAGGVDPSAINGLGAAIEKSQVLEKELGVASQTIEQIKNPNSKTANNLERLTLPPTFPRS